MHPVAELSEIAREFHHLQAEHAREGVAGSWRRRQGAQLEELERKFETLLSRWVPETNEQARWRTHLYDGADAPQGAPAEPPIFRGRSELGTMLLIRASESGDQEWILDGTPVAHWPALRPIESPLHFGELVFEEVFEAPARALDALAEYVDARAVSPPWSSARELYEDGLVDATFALTERGRRFQASRMR